jgi:hypothetical protein
MKEVTMLRTSSRFFFVLSLIVLCVGGGTFAAQTGNAGLGFGGNVGLSFSYAPVPPYTFNIASELTLGVHVGGFALSSETGFDLSGFQSEKVAASLSLGAVQIGDDVRFEPVFTWNRLSVDAQIFGVSAGVDLILANLGGVQTPTYSMGTVLELSSGIVCGFSITSLTGFGATDLVNAIGGVSAPFSHKLLGLFHHIDALFASGAPLDVTIVPGFGFGEQLVRLEVDTAGLLASTTTWFDSTGFSQEILEFGYRFDEPGLAFLSSLTLDQSFSISHVDLILDLQIDPVQFTSKTSFAAAGPSSPLPVAFAGQAFAVSAQICGVTVTSETTFDNTFLFSGERIAVEATFNPVSFASLTSFDGSGFSGQALRASITFGGITLSTSGSFDAGGITQITFGFMFKF